MCCAPSMQLLSSDGTAIEDCICICAVMELAALDLDDDDSPRLCRSALQDVNGPHTPDSSRRTGKQAAAKLSAQDREPSGGENRDPAAQHFSLHIPQRELLVDDSSAHAKAQWQEAAADEEQAPLMQASAAKAHAPPWYKQRQVGALPCVAQHSRAWPAVRIIKAHTALKADVRYMNWSRGGRLLSC